MLEVNTLGGLRLSIKGDQFRDLGSRKAEAILVYLVVKPGKHSRKVLAALFWPDHAENQALTSLRVALSLLKKDLDDYLEISRNTVEIKPGAEVYLDVTDLENKLTRGEIDQALDIYQGDFLQGFFIRDCLDFEDWRLWQQEQVRRLVISALHNAISTAIEEASYTKGQHFTQRLLELDALDELAHRKYMLLLALGGERARAVEHYEHCRAILQTELGIEPCEETKVLYSQILGGERPGRDSSLVPPANLPGPQTSFIDRKQELDQISTLISDSNCRLLSLIGPGGVGKTRLAIKAISKCYQSFSDGSYFIPLEGVHSSQYLVHTIANGIHFTIDTFATQLDAKSQLLDYLKNRCMLLVLDGFEHLVKDARLLSDVLSHAARVKIMVTSRQKLNIISEWVFPVKGLPISSGIEQKESRLPGALSLFIERSRQANITFALRDADRENAIQICQLAEGMPLAIELAAAWTTALSPGGIAEEIKKSLDFLSSSKLDGEEKHHSLRATIDGSWLLLDQGQRDTFCRLSVFQGGFGRDAAINVAGINLSQLSSLLDRSLLTRDQSGRFRMHALLRKYAGEKLESSSPTWEQVYHRHCLYYTDLLISREADLNGQDMLATRDELRREIENIRAAVNWAVVHWDTEKVGVILNALLTFYVVHGWHEGRDTYAEIAEIRKKALMEQTEPDWANDTIYVCARAHQAFLMCNLGQGDESDVISRACLEPLQRLDIKQALSECIHNLGVNASFRGEYEFAMEHLEQAILIGREGENIIWYSYLLWLGHTYFLLGEYDSGLESLQKCYELYEQKGNLWGMAFAMSKMGLAATGLGEFVQAKQYHQQALGIFEKNGNQAGKAYALSRMSTSAYFLKDYPQAVELAQAGYQIFQLLGHHWGICNSLCGLGFGYLGLGDMPRADEYFRQALEESGKYQMTPLSLYALAGVSATLVQARGEEKSALELFQYIKNHPQTPALYIQQAAKWFDPEVLHNWEKGNSISNHGDRIEPVEVVIQRLLRVEEKYPPQTT